MVSIACQFCVVDIGHDCVDAFYVLFVSEAASSSVKCSHAMIPTRLSGRQLDTEASKM
jgi:hypothetical protein